MIRPAHRPAQGGLYAINAETSDTQVLLAWAQAVLEGGAGWLQYRDKGPDQKRRLHQACALVAVCRQFGARLIVNDDVELADSCGADGVHLGRDDGEVADARARLGARAIIGVSCYDDLDRARTLARAGASYLAFGAFHPSRSKPDTRRASPELLGQARELDLPLVAIGGITADNGADLIRAGADWLAVIAGLQGPPDQARTLARRYVDLFNSNPTGFSL